MGVPSGVILWSFYLVLCQAIPPPLDITELRPKEPQCLDNLNSLRQGFRSGQPWAEAILDAGVRSPVGVLSQTGVQFGDYDECLRLSAPFATQFCMLDVFPVARNYSSWSSLKWGVCLPASCHTWDLQTSLQEYMDNRTNQGEAVKVVVTPETCTSRETRYNSMTMGDFAFCLLAGIVILVVCIATINDIMLDPKYDGLSPPKTLTQCISMRHSWHSLLRVDQAPDGINLEPLYGIHIVAIFFIVLGHRYGVHFLYMSLTNYKAVQDMFANPWSSIWTSHLDLFVDVYFFMSAFLLALFYSTFLDKFYVSPFTVYYKRLCRLLPAYLVVLFYYATLIRHAGDGPLWNLVMGGEQSNCANYWWTNILFINNYVAREYLCLPQTWYLSCDFQLFVIGTLLVFLLHKNYRTGVIVSLVLFVASTLAPFLATYFYNLPAMMLHNRQFWTNPRHNVMFGTVFSQAHYRGTSYLPGLFAGIYVYKRKIKSISKKWSYFLQTAGLFICHVVYWSGSLFYDESVQYSRLVASLYAAFFHSVFGLGLALLTISWTIGQSTPLSSLLSWRGFVPLGKLSYSVFLVHFVLPFVWLASSRTTVYLNPLELVSWSIADFALSLIPAFLLFITVEIPVRNLLRYFMRTEISGIMLAMKQSTVVET